MLQSKQSLQDAGSGFLVGDGITWVDVLLANSVAGIEQEEPRFLADYPEVVLYLISDF